MEKAVDENGEEYEIVHMTEGEFWAALKKQVRKGLK
jgi:hypothetical protein